MVADFRKENRVYKFSSATPDSSVCQIEKKITGKISKNPKSNHSSC